MKFHKNISILFLLILFCGCDLIFQPKEKETSVEKKERIKREKMKEKLFGKSPKQLKIEICNVLRADLFTIVLDGKTQNFHIAGLLAPTTTRSRFNRFLTKKFKFDTFDLMKTGKEGVNFLREITGDRTSRLKISSSKTNGAGKVIIEGDIIFGDATSLREKLLEMGFAVVNGGPEDGLTYLERLELQARNEEAGIWKNSLELRKRFRIESDFEFKTISVQTDKIRAQTQSATASGRTSDKSGHVQETHRHFEKQAEIIVKIDARKPVQRIYKGVAKYTFYTKESIGKRQQEISLAAPRGKLKRDGTYKPLSSSDKEKKRRDERKARDYNRKVKGQKVYGDDAAFEKSVEFELNSLSTNLVFASDVVEFTESKKAGVNYETGTQYVGYDLEVWIEGELLYTHKLKR